MLLITSNHNIRVAIARGLLSMASGDADIKDRGILEYVSSVDLALQCQKFHFSRVDHEHKAALRH